MDINLASRLSDAELRAEVKRLAGCERQATVRLVVHLAEMDARQLYLADGFSSLFAYCTEVLRLSEHEAYNRIEAARAARRFPLLVEPLEAGALSLTTVRLLAPHLTDRNAPKLLAAASGKSKREVEELLARFFPRRDVPSSIRKLPAAKSLALSEPSPTQAPAGGAPPEPALLVGAAVPVDTLPVDTLPLGATMPVRLPDVPASRPATTVPLAPDRYQIKFTASASTCEKLRLAQDLLRHAVPNGDMAEVIDRALTALIEEVGRRKFAATERPRAGRTAADRSRHVPASVKREVWIRDSGRCVFVARGGRRCNERRFLEFHHLDPYAVGGEATVANIQLRCRAHNAYEAHLYYGDMRPTAADGMVRDPAVRYRVRGESPTRSGTSWSRGSASDG